MKRATLLTIFLVLLIGQHAFAQEKDTTDASTLGNPLTVDSKEDFKYFGNWEVIPSKSDAENISLMPEQDGPTGPYFFLSPTTDRSSISNYLEGEYHSVDLGFNAYRKGSKFYGNLTTSVAVVFEVEHEGELIEFTCEYLEEEDQLKLTTSDHVVFYLQRIG